MKRAYYIRCIFCLGIIAASQFSSAEGNITTTSGDLYLQPAGGNVWVNGALKTLGSNIDFYAAGSGKPRFYSDYGVYFVYSTRSPYTTQPIFQFTSDTSGSGSAIIAGPNRMAGSDLNNFLQIATTSNYGEVFTFGNSMHLELAAKSGEVRLMDYDKPSSDYFKFDMSGSIPKMTCDTAIGNSDGCDIGTAAIPMRNIYAFNFTDMTPFYGDGAKALTILGNIRSDRNGEIDHNTLDPFIRGDGDTRNIGATVSVLTAAVNELNERNNALEERVKELEQNCVQTATKH
jgi:hypothetical protein